MYVQKTEFEKDIEFRHIKNLSGFKGLLPIIEVKINFSFGFDNAIIKQTNYKMYMDYTVQLHSIFTIRTRGQSVRRWHRKRNSEKSEMVTYNIIDQTNKL